MYEKLSGWSWLFVIFPSLSVISFVNTKKLMLYICVLLTFLSIWAGERGGTPQTGYNTMDATPAGTPNVR